MKISFNLPVLNLGGGFGIRYTEEDNPKPASEYVEEIIAEVKKQAAKIQYGRCLKFGLSQGDH